MTSRAELAWCHAELGMFPEGRPSETKGSRWPRRSITPAALCWPLGRSVGCLSAKATCPRRFPYSNGPWASVRRRLPGLFPPDGRGLRAAYTLCGRVADAVPLLTRAMEQSTATERVYFETLCRLSLGGAYLVAGHPEEAHALAEHTLALAREHQERGHQAYALRLLGEIAARGDLLESDQSGDYYRQALALAEELGMRPLVAHCHLGLGKLYAKIGRHAKARAELSAAVELYRAMEMTLWLPEAEAVLAQVA